MPKTEFCIVGFPKCGTSALIRCLGASPFLHMVMMDGNPTSGYFHRTSMSEKPDEYVEGKVNGQKNASYIYTVAKIKALLDDNPDVLLIANVRDVRESLVSWQRMHKRIAEEGQPAKHFINARGLAEEYLNHTPEEYYEAFAKDRLQYDKYIDRVREKFPAARFLVVSQDIMTRELDRVAKVIHEKLGLEPPEEYLAQFRKEHETYGASARRSNQLSPELTEELVATNARIRAALNRLPEDQRIVVEDPDDPTRF